MLFSTRETPNSSERLKTTVANEEDAVGERLNNTQDYNALRHGCSISNVAMDNCVRELDTLQCVSNSTLLLAMKIIIFAWDLCTKYNHRFVKYEHG